MGCTDSKPAGGRKNAARPQQKTQKDANNNNVERTSVTTAVKSPTSPAPLKVKSPTVKQKTQPVEDPVGSVFSDGGTVASPTVATPRLLVPGRMVLYYHPVSQPCRSVVWYLNYKKRDAFRQVVDLIAGEQHSAKFLSLRNCPQVPLLHDGDAAVISESSAILKYLSQTTEPTDTTMDRYTAFPPTAEAMARINEYIALHHTHVRRFTTDGFSPIFFATPEDRPSVVKHVMKDLSPQLAIWDKVLEKQKFIAGEEMTICDFLFVPEVDQLLAIKLLEGYPHLTEYLERMKDVEGYAKASEVFYGTLKAMQMIS